MGFWQWLVAPIRDRWARIEFVLWAAKRFNLSEGEVEAMLDRTIAASRYYSNNTNLDGADWLSYADSASVWRLAMKGAATVGIDRSDLLFGNVFVWTTEVLD